MKIKTLAAVFPLTIPVMTGYIFLGAAYGLLMRAAGMPPLVPIAMSIVVFSGAIQFIAISMLCSPLDIAGAFLVSLMVGARHIFYGISMLERYRGLGARKIFLAHTLTDETFSILCTTDPPNGIPREEFYTAVSALDFSYWVTGTAIGAVIGELASSGVRGLDFALTSLFVVIFTDQLIKEHDHTASVIGVLAAALALALFGPGSFIIWAMAMIAAALTALRGRLEAE